MPEVNDSEELDNARAAKLSDSHVQKRRGCESSMLERETEHKIRHRVRQRDVRTETEERKTKRESDRQSYVKRLNLGMMQERCAICGKDRMGDVF
jgi:hypothetical protein